MMRGFLCFGVILVTTFTLLTTPTLAHVLVKDGTDTRGMIVHITPADEPIIGKKTDIFFDIQNENVQSANLIVRTPAQSVDVPVEQKNGSLSASYTFGQPGVYTLILTTGTEQDTYTFHHTLHVGASDESVTSPSIWATVGLSVSLVLLCLLGATAFSRRANIRRQSR